MASSVQMFDHQQHRRAQRRAQRLAIAAADFLKCRMAEDLASRLGLVPRRFARALDLGAHGGQLGGLLPSATVIYAEPVPAAGVLPSGRAVAADAEWLPFADASFDLIVSAGALHWTNDLPGALIQINHALTPDGLFIAALVGGASLFELRESLMVAEEALTGRVLPRVSPFLDVRQAGALLQRAGFAMPVADSDVVTLEYRDPLALLRDLRAMGETNALVERRPLRRDVLMAAMAHYQDRHGMAAGRVPATIEIIHMLGWAPGPGQPKPLRPGSARARLADALGTREHSAGERAAHK